MACDSLASGVTGSAGDTATSLGPGGATIAKVEGSTPIAVGVGDVGRVVVVLVVILVPVEVV